MEQVLWHSHKKVVGVLAISLSSSLTSAEVLEILDQHNFLLENAIAQSEGYRKVTILGVDPARRLREAAVTHCRVRFQAEIGIHKHSGHVGAKPAKSLRAESEGGLRAESEANHNETKLEKALQESFTRAGFDFNVFSATIVTSSTEVPASSSQDGRLDQLSKGIIGVLATCLVLISVAFLVWRWWAARRATTPVVVIDLKENVSSEKIGNDNLAMVIAVKEKDSFENDDLASVSTGTPSSCCNALSP